jgi:branched-chain amino acid transport system permease protein
VNGPGRATLRDAVVIAGVGLIAMALLPFAFDVYTLTLLVIYGLLAMSLGFIWGFGGVLCFGQAAFYGLGAYTYAIAAINFGEVWGALVLGIAVAALFAAVLGGVLFYGRLSDVYLAVVTLVATLILFKYMNSTAGEAYRIGEARLGGFNGIPGFPVLHVPGDPEAWLIDESLYYFCFAVLLVVYFATRWLLRSSFGRIIVAIRENELRAELMGYDVRLYKTVTFTIGGAIAGLAGCLYANWAEIVTPTMFSLGQSAEIIIWVIVGGMGTLLGPVLGAAGLGYLKFLLGQQALLDNVLVLGVLLVLAVLVLPQGLLPTVQRLVRARGRARAPRARWGASARRTRKRRNPHAA